MARVVIAFDPGPHTGLAVFIDGVLNHATTMTYDPKDAAQVYARLRYALTNARMEAGGQRLTTLCETFHSRRTGIAVSSDGMFTARLAGWIEGNALVGGDDFHWAEPSVKLAYEKDARELAPDASPHARDAIAHGLRWLALKQGATS